MFFANDGVHGEQEWISDGTAAGTIMLTSGLASNSSNPDGFATLPNAPSLTAPAVINGTDADDTLTAAAGASQQINGMGGDDVIFMGNGAETINGGDGYDTVHTTDSFANELAQKSGSDWSTFTLTNINGPGDGLKTLTGVEVVQFSDATLQVDSGSTHPWDHIMDLTTAGIQTIWLDNGGSWTNTVGAGNAGPILWQSSYSPDGGQTTSQITATNDDGTHSLQIFDLTNQYAWSDATITYDANWNVTGVSGHMDGGGSATTLAMAAVEPALDTLLWFTHPYDPDFGGPAENQTLTGTSGTDVLYGFAGNDVLNGGAGNDVLDGGQGDDTLTGGGGADTFVFHAGDGNDTITDFTSGTDVIDLRGLGIADFSTLESMMTQSFNNTVITFDAADKIVLSNVDMGTLRTGDFLLH